MIKRIKKIIAVLCVVCLVAALAGVPSLAAEEEYVEVPLYVDGIRGGTAYKYEYGAYVKLDEFCAAMLGSISTAAGADGSTVYTAPGLEISLAPGSQVMTANGRCFYIPQGVKQLGGALCVPVGEAAKCFGSQVIWSDEDWTINIDTWDMAILKSADEYYNADDLYWLSHIISAEAQGESMQGKIGVGNVVMNRAASDKFDESTVKDVIFAPGQFTPAESGSVYMDPVPEAIQAAKMALEGYNTVGDSTYFVNGSFSWAIFVIRIGNHNFYYL